MNLSGIQLMFTNGVESPIFESDTSRDRELTTIDIDISKSVRKLGLLVSNSNYIFGIKLLDEKNREIIWEEWNGEVPGHITWKYQKIPEGQEIIGVYGNKTKGGYSIKQLGFVMWKPNPLAVE